MEGILSYSSNLNKQNTFGWILESSTSLDSKIEKYIEIRGGKLSFCIPLNRIFRFAECYNKIIYGVKHSLSLYGYSNSGNTVYINDSTKFEAKFIITKLNWSVPRIMPSLEMQNNR